MTSKQVTMTLIEFGKAWKARQAAGGAKKLNREEWRVSLKIRAGAVDRYGHPLSSRGMNNDHVDRFLALCKSYSDPANLDAQLDLDDQSILRALHASKPLLDLLQIDDSAREKYLGGVYHNLQRKRVREDGIPELELHQMPDPDLGLILAALTHTVEHKLGAAHNHPRSGKGWRSQTAHRVGQRKAGQKTASQEPAKPRRTTPVSDPLPFDQNSPF